VNLGVWQGFASVSVASRAVEISGPDAWASGLEVTRRPKHFPGRRIGNPLDQAVEIAWINAAAGARPHELAPWSNEYTAQLLSLPELRPAADQALEGIDARVAAHQL
jgi:hypothetical protein